MNRPYKTRQGGATVTIFVPYDCNNHCPFCINKKEYKDTSGFSLENICDSIRLMDSLTPNCDFVITGGEPMADLASLQRILDTIPKTHKVFLNTTFPAQSDFAAEKFLAFMDNNKSRISCANISRHLIPYVKETPDDLLSKIPTPKRVNCVLCGDYPKEKLLPFVARFDRYRIPIQFRADYTKITPDNLYEQDGDNILHDLKTYFDYRGLGGCRMRNDFHFSHNGAHLTYHRTLPYSTITEKGGDGITYDILYDILIKQTGAILSDWTDDQPKLDLDAYRNVCFEPNDHHVIDGCVDF